MKKTIVTHYCFIIVLPENIDTIRATLQTNTREESIKKTNDSLCIGGPTS